MRQNASKSHYHYVAKITDTAKLILIKDLDMGGMSVTNNIENIIEQICFENNLDPKEITCAYQDSMGMICGFNYSTGEFYPIIQNDLRMVCKNMLNG